jgi:hypothetical protein
MSGAIPATFDDVTPAWLSEATGLPIASFTAQPVGVGVGLMGELIRVTPVYSHAHEGAPESLIVKLPSSAEANKAMGVMFRLYEREHCFYETIAPSTRIRVPHLWCAAMDLPAEQFVLVLEDLARWDTADQLIGLDVERAVAAVRELAPFHAEWWESERLHELQWMPRVSEPTELQMGEYFRQLWPLFAERWASVLPEGAIDLGVEVGEAFERVLLAMDRGPLTIAHADFRLDNLFFRGTDVAIIDWQVPAKTVGAYDVAYLVSQSMTVHDRRAHGEDVLRAWHDALLAAGVIGYSWDAAVADYAMCVLACLAVPVTTGAEFEAGNERGQQLITTIIERGFAAALDVDWKALIADASRSAEPEEQETQ